MDTNIINNIMVSLIESFNERNNDFFLLWTDNSKLIYENKTLIGNDIKDFWSNLNYKLDIKKYDNNIIGDRRANILLSGKMLNLTSETFNNIINQNIIFTIYFQLAIDNNKKYWIHSAIIQIFR